MLCLDARWFIDLDFNYSMFHASEDVRARDMSSLPFPPHAPPNHHQIARKQKTNHEAKNANWAARLTAHYVDAMQFHKGEWKKCKERFREFSKIAFAFVRCRFSKFIELSLPLLHFHLAAKNFDFNIKRPMQESMKRRLLIEKLLNGAVRRRLLNCCWRSEKEASATWINVREMKLLKVVLLQLIFLFLNESHRTRLAMTRLLPVFRLRVEFL